MSSFRGDLARSFRGDLARLINTYSLENGSNTPDFILADYLARCLDTFDQAVQEREVWYGHTHEPGGVVREVSR